MVVVSTASPYKFPETMEEILGRPINMSDHVKGLLSKRERSVPLPADTSAVRKYLLSQLAG
jgi:threonine synthase